MACSSSGRGGTSTTRGRALSPRQALEHDAARIQAATGRPHVLLSDNDPFTSDWRRNGDVWVEAARRRTCGSARAPDTSTRRTSPPCWLRSASSSSRLGAARPARFFGGSPMRAIAAPAIQKVEVVVRRHSRMRAAGRRRGEAAGPRRCPCVVRRALQPLRARPVLRGALPLLRVQQGAVRAGMLPPTSVTCGRSADVRRPATGFTSLYVGGGTPSLCLASSPPARGGDGRAGARIEVLPNHATPETVAELQALGFDYVSIGIQSFDPRMLRHLGRLNTAGDNRRALEATAVLRLRQRRPHLRRRLRRARRLPGRPRDLRRRGRPDLDLPADAFRLHAVRQGGARSGARARAAAAGVRLADGLGYERRAVWTFTRRGGPLYASIARELFLGSAQAPQRSPGRTFS